MAITVYAGLQGSGKTYEVVTTVVLAALRTGRRVVANIRGLHFEEMQAYLIDTEGMEADKIGEVLSVDLLVPSEDPHFFYDGRDVDSITQPGDLVVVDECWKNLSVDSKISARTMDFFRMHRQHVNAAGVSCDIVLITQHMSDLNRKVRVVVEKHFIMDKLKRLGLSKRYRVWAYDGHRTVKGALLREYDRKYDKKLFPFYSSYVGKGGDEREVDKRANAMRSPIIVIGLPVAVLLFAAGAWGLNRIYQRGITGGMVGKVASSAAGDSKAAAAGATGTATGAGAPGAANAGAAGSSGLMLPGGAGDGEWRAVGFYTHGGRLTAVVERGGRVRLVTAPESYRLTGADFQVYVDGKLVTAYSGVGVGGRGGVTGR